MLLIKKLAQMHMRSLTTCTKHFQHILAAYEPEP